MVAADWNDLTDGTLDAPIDRNQYGETENAFWYAWTNVNADGTTKATDPFYTCHDWAWSGITEAYGGVGTTYQKSDTWSRDNNYGCNLQGRLYCIQQQEDYSTGE